ncbi:hypothetical protein Ccar_16230 [Clostridium carboxidivorans P7]|uniref:Uncharacterized protein n=1 Tax=Clostridium carboxidivorans P7 TaxID=536227 RepID=C6PT21_9CLOT|nr:hypothetical protein [Clostridium carboxidivorans]AKN32326.1 hypothetical protein Ccar_16230 [Clostridium carboxidivorans P7]EET87656.1 hypothetical protein CcarbDRAFT_1938 [Clostridium carboxidivorans P7]
MEKILNVQQEKERILEEFRKETLPECYKAKKLIESKLNMEVRIRHTVTSETYPSGITQYYKYLEIDILENNVDYKTITIFYGSIENQMESQGTSFEDAVFEEFMYNLTYKSKDITEYKGNIWQKLLDTYIRDQVKFPDGNDYYIDSECYLWCDKEFPEPTEEDDDERYINVVNVKDITGIDIKEKWVDKMQCMEMTIYTDDEKITIDWEDGLKKVKI